MTQYRNMTIIDLTPSWRGCHCLFDAQLREANLPLGVVQVVRSRKKSKPKMDINCVLI